MKKRITNEDLAKSIGGLTTKLDSLTTTVDDLAISVKRRVSMLEHKVLKPRSA